MTDFTPQSTDRIPIDTNPFTPRVLLKGSTTITTSDPGGGSSYYLGSDTIDLSAYDFSSTVCEAEVYAVFSGADLTDNYAKCPYTNISTISGQISQHVGYALRRGTAKSTQIHGATYTLALYIWHYARTNNLTITVHYQIKSTPAAPFD